MPDSHNPTLHAVTAPHTLDTGASNEGSRTFHNHGELGTLAQLSKGRSESQFLVYLLWVTPVLFSKVFVSVLNVKASVILEYSRTFRLKLYWTLWAGVINTGCNFAVRHLARLGTICPDGVKIVPACSRFAHTPQPEVPPAPAPTQHYVVPRVRGIIRFPPQPSPNI